MTLRHVSFNLVIYVFRIQYFYPHCFSSNVYYFRYCHSLIYLIWDATRATLNHSENRSTLRVPVLCVESGGSTGRQKGPGFWRSRDPTPAEHSRQTKGGHWPFQWTMDRINGIVLAKPQRGKIKTDCQVSQKTANLTLELHALLT